jgi:hypothetical protein
MSDHRLTDEQFDELMYQLYSHKRKMVEGFKIHENELSSAFINFFEGIKATMQRIEKVYPQFKMRYENEPEKGE